MHLFSWSYDISFIIFRCNSLCANLYFIVCSYYCMVEINVLSPPVSMVVFHNLSSLCSAHHFWLKTHCFDLSTSTCSNDPRPFLIIMWILVIFIHIIYLVKMVILIGIGLHYILIYYYSYFIFYLWRFSFFA